MIKGLHRNPRDSAQESEPPPSNSSFVDRVKEFQLHAFGSRIKPFSSSVQRTTGTYRLDEDPDTNKEATPLDRVSFLLPVPFVLYSSHS